MHPRIELQALQIRIRAARDERDPEVWLSCLRGEGCAASRAEQATLEAQALALRVAAALRDRELQRFLP